jgi:polyhydroxybutyrate depolymerase
MPRCARSQSTAPTRRLPRTLAVGLAGVALIVGAGACGSSGSSSSAKTAASATTRPPAASTTTLVADHAPAAPSAGCKTSDHGAATAGTTTVHLKVGDLDRWSLRHVPAGARTGQPLPLVVDLHGYGQGPKLQAARTRFDKVGDTNGFVTLTPNGRYEPVLWNPRPDSPDVTFIGALLDKTEADLCIDENRVYVSGFSNGAFMASTLACTMPDRIAAIAAASGLRANPKCTDPRPVPVIAFHGTTDSYVPYGGGLGPLAKKLVNPVNPKLTIGKTPEADSPLAVPGTTDQSMPDVMAAWAKRDGCEAKASETPFVPEVTKISYSCPDGVAVELFRTTGGEHLWPGSKDAIEHDSSLGHGARTIDATALAWDFFRAHARHQR